MMISSEANEQLVRDFICEFQKARKRAQIKSNESYSLDQVAEIMGELDYAVTPELLSSWQERGILQQLEHLTLQECFSVMAALEVRRQWKCSPSRHDRKKSKVRLHRESLPVDEARQVLDSTSKVDTLFLVSCLASAETENEREQIYELLLPRINRHTAEFAEAR